MTYNPAIVVPLGYNAESAAAAAEVSLPELIAKTQVLESLVTGLSGAGALSQSTTLTPTASWDDVYGTVQAQVSPLSPVAVNWQAQALLNRTHFLKGEVDDLKEGITNLWASIVTGKQIGRAHV